MVRSKIRQKQNTNLSKINRANKVRQMRNLNKISHSSQDSPRFGIPNYIAPNNQIPHHPVATQTHLDELAMRKREPAAPQGWDLRADILRGPPKS